MTLLDSIRSAGPKPDKVPEGWYTIAQMATASGKAESSVGRALRILLADRKAVMRKFKIQTQGRGVYPVPHYKAKE